mgnify:CR=1 FL=1
MTQELDEVQDEEGPRNLTKADVKAIVAELEKAMVDRFYTNLGRGVWAAVWALIVAALLFLAAWGSKLEAKIGGSA